MCFSKAGEYFCKLLFRHLFEYPHNPFNQTESSLDMTAKKNWYTSKKKNGDTRSNVVTKSCAVHVCSFSMLRCVISPLRKKLRNPAVLSVSVFRSLFLITFCLLLSRPSSSLGPDSGGEMVRAGSQFGARQCFMQNTTRPSRTKPPPRRTVIPSPCGKKEELGSTSKYFTGMSRSGVDRKT